MDSKIETKNKREWGITGIHGKRSGRRRPPRSGSDEEPMDPEHRRALQGNGDSNRRQEQGKRMGAKGKKRNPFGPRP
jgi:hypothetical protein